MHRIRTWAHRSAHENNFNPWSQSDATRPLAGKPPLPAGNSLNPASSGNVNDNNLESANGGGESEKDKPNASKPRFRRFMDNVKKVLFRNWVNVLLIFVPAGIAVHFAGINPNVVFALNAIAIIPLAGLLTFATESVAHRLGPTLGALLNVSFGNAVELIIFIALVKNEIRVVQASLVGSILANLLLILGMAFLIGGLQYREQIYDSTVTQMSACMLALAVLSLLIPSAFHASFSNNTLADAAVLKLSRGSSVILLLTYVLYLLFQLKSHAYLYEGTPQHIVDQQTEPGFLARFDSSGSSSRSTSISVSTADTSTSGTRRRVKKKLKTKLGMRRKTKVEVVDEIKIADTIDRPKSASENDITNLAASQEPSSNGLVVGFNLPESSHASPSKAIQSPQIQGNLSAPPARPTIRSALSIRPPPVFRTATQPVPFTRSTTQSNTFPISSPPLPQNQLRRLRSTPDAVHHSLQNITADHRVNSNLSHNKTELVEEAGPPLSQVASIVLLLVSTGLVALCAEFLVGSIEHLVESTPLSEAFVGLIILPIVGNAAEHVTAVTVAAKNKLDLALGVSLGSSIQIALFVTPVVVLLGWCLDRSMSLYFTLFETASLFVSTFIVNFLVLDGRSNYLEGALLCACYVIIGVGAYFFPDGQDQSSLSGGTSST